MSEQNTNTWPFSEIPDADDLDISAIFGGSGTATNDNGKNPFEAPAPPVPADAAPVTPQTPPAATVPPAAAAQPTAPRRSRGDSRRNSSARCPSYPGSTGSGSRSAPRSAGGCHSGQPHRRRL